MATAEPTSETPLPSDAHPTGRPAGRRARLLAALLVAGAAWVSVTSLAVSAWHEARVPGDAAIDAAVAHIRAGFTPGDAVVVLPNWNETPRIELEGLGPGLERWPFPALIRGNAIDPLELLRFERVWVMGTFGKSPSLPTWVLGDAPPLAQADHGDGVWTALYPLPRLDLRASLTKSLADLTITRLLPDGRRVACPHRAGSHRCGLDPWLDPHLERRDVHHREVDWLYAHPGPGNAVLSIEWPDVPDGAALVVRAGPNQKAVRSEPGGTTYIRTYVDGRHVDTIALHPHRYVLERRLVPLGTGRSHRVRFEVQADPPDWRQVMLEADVLAEVPAAVRSWTTPAAP